MPASNGTATILTLNAGFDIYDLPLSNHPIDQEEYGDQMTADSPYIEEERMQQGSIEILASRVQLNTRSSSRHIP
jgi:hypothetical protein